MNGSEAERLIREAASVEDSLHAALLKEARERIADLEGQIETLRIQLENSQAECERLRTGQPW